jgi:hypothetical protein
VARATPFPSLMPSGLDGGPSGWPASTMLAVDLMPPELAIMLVRSCGELLPQL